MVDDSFVHEINEEIRQERTRALWGKYGPIFLGIVIFLIVTTAIYQFYSSYQEKKIDKMGDQFLEIIQLNENGKTKDALEKLEIMKKTNVASYKYMASIYAGITKNKEGNFKDALLDYKNVLDAKNAPSILKYLARIKAAYIYLDHGTLEDVQNCVSPLLSGNMKNSAYIILGYAQWKYGKADKALKSFQEVVEKGTNISQIIQARTMINLLNSDVTIDKSLPFEKIIQEKAVDKNKDVPLSENKN